MTTTPNLPILFSHATPVQDLRTPRPDPDEFGRLVAAWILSYRESAATRAAYRSDFTQWCDWLATEGGGTHPMHAQRRHGDGWATRLAHDGAAPATIARKLGAISGFYRYAVAEGAVTVNPIASIRRPKISRTHTDTIGLDAHEATALLTAAQARGPRAAAIVAILLTLGIRVSELTGATVPDLKTERGHRTLTVTRKGGKKQSIPVPPLTARLIDAYLSGRTEGPLIITRTGRAMDRHEILVLLAGRPASGGRRGWKGLVTRAGLDKKLTPHVLRHSMITLGLDAGATLRDMQVIAGHEDPRTTERYDGNKRNLDRQAATLSTIAALVAPDDDPEEGSDDH